MNSASINIDEAQAHLREIISQLAPGSEVVIRDAGVAVARLLPGPGAGRLPDGSAPWMSPDFDAPLDDFEEYMH